MKQYHYHFWVFYIQRQFYTMIGNFLFKSVFIQALWRIVDNWAGMKQSWLFNWFVGQWNLIGLLDRRLWFGEGLVGLVRLRVDGCHWKGKWDKSFNILVHICTWKNYSFLLHVTIYVSYQLWWNLILMVPIFYANTVNVQIFVDTIFRGLIFRGD